MSLKFSELNFQLYLKSGARLAIKEGYEQLAKAGWEPTGTYHQKDNSWIWERGEADIRYDVTHKFDWKVQVGIDEYGMDGDIKSITRDVDAMLLEIVEKRIAFHDALYMVSSGQGVADDFSNGVA